MDQLYQQIMKDKWGAWNQQGQMRFQLPFLQAGVEQENVRLQQTDLDRALREKLGMGNLELGQGNLQLGQRQLGEQTRQFDLNLPLLQAEQKWRGDTLAFQVRDAGEKNALTGRTIDATIKQTEALIETTRISAGAQVEVAKEQANSLINNLRENARLKGEEAKRTLQDEASKQKKFQENFTYYSKLLAPEIKNPAALLSAATSLAALAGNPDDPATQSYVRQVMLGLSKAEAEAAKVPGQVTVKKMEMAAAAKTKKQQGMTATSQMATNLINAVDLIQSLGINPFTDQPQPLTYEEAMQKANPLIKGQPGFDAPDKTALFNAMYVRKLRPEFMKRVVAEWQTQAMQQINAGQAPISFTEYLQSVLGKQQQPAAASSIPAPPLYQKSDDKWIYGQPATRSTQKKPSGTFPDLRLQPSSSLIQGTLEKSLAQANQNQMMLDAKRSLEA